MADNIFLKIISGEIPCSKVYEDDKVLALLDIAPANKGHTLVIPKQEYETMDQVPDDVAATLINVAKKVAGKMMDELKCDGYNILTNNKLAAGQVVPHVHLHVIPRYKEDGFRLIWPMKKDAYAEGEMEGMAKRLSVQ